MATQKKDYGPPASAAGKEKRGKSPSPSYPRPHIDPRHSDSPRSKKSPTAPPPITTPPLPSDHHHHKPVSTPPAEKRVPNYLKPTRSSSLDHPNSTTTTQNSTLNRRRSFDKPPSPSLLHKAQHSSFGSSVERNPRPSSSVLTKTKSLPKPLQDRPLKSVNKDAGKSHPRVPSSTIKKSISTTNTNTGVIKKQNNATSTSSASAVATTKAPSSTTSPDIAESESTPPPVHEPCQEDQESSVTDVEEEVVVKDESNHELPAEISVQGDKEPENKNNQHEGLKPSEPSTVLEDQNETLDVQIEEPEEEKVVVEHEASNSYQEEEEKNESQTEPKVEGEEEEEEEERGGEESGIENEGNQTVLEKEKEVGDDVGTTETKAEVKNVEAAESSARQGGGQGKKDPQTQQQQQQQAYNDMIEETASKLLEKRKNKVKALVGAFETVISLQEPEA